MNSSKHIVPKLGEKFFTCPHCGTLTTHEWNITRLPIPNSNLYEKIDINENPVSKAKCQACGEFSIWYKGEMIFPKQLDFKPNEDLSDCVKADFIEATKIFSDSPRSAAALLRLCIEKICHDLGKSGNLNAMIGELVRDGLPSEVQKMLDIVRVIGNNSVHPGQISLDDDRDTAEALLEIVNQIAYQMISKPKKIDAMYDNLPESIRNKIIERDAKYIKGNRFQ